MSERTDRFIQWFGWYGTAAILVAFTLASFDLLEFESLAAASLNATGCLGVALASQRRKAHQAAVINAFLCVVAAVAVLRALVA